MDESRVVSLHRNWKTCPFRGLQPQPKARDGSPMPPTQIPLDHRCPSTIRAIEVTVDTGLTLAPAEPAKRGRPRKGEVRVPIEVKPAEEVAMLVGVLEEDSGCYVCLTSRIREKEMGISHSDRPTVTFKKRK